MKYEVEEKEKECLGLKHQYEGIQGTMASFKDDLVENIDHDLASFHNGNMNGVERMDQQLENMQIQSGDLILPFFDYYSFQIDFVLKKS